MNLRVPVQGMKIHVKIVSFIRRLRSAYYAYFAQTIIRFPKMFLPIGSNFLPAQSKENHFLIENFYFQSIPKLPFLIFVFVLGSVSKNVTFPCNEFYSGSNICICKVSDPSNVPLYQVVLSFCWLIVFSFVLSFKSLF